MRRGLGCLERDMLFVGASAEDIFVELSREGFLALREVDSKALCDATCYQRGVIVSTLGAAGREKAADFSSRFFAPKVGIEEDPACGSAHCVLVVKFIHVCVRSTQINRILRRLRLRRT